MISVSSLIGWRRVGAPALALLLGLSAAWPTEAHAQYGGGRLGGRSGFQSRRALPSPSGPGRYAPYGGYPGRSFPGPSFGFPGFFPFAPFIPLGRGSGGLGPFGVILLLGIGALVVFVLVNDVRTRVSGGQGWRGYGSRQRGTGTCTVAMLQLALLATARPVIEELGALARRARTDTPEGLAEALGEVSVLLGRRPEVWSAARWLVDRAEDLDGAEARLQEWSARERMKTSREAFANVEGRVREAAPAAAQDEVGAGFVVAVIVAIDRPMFDTIAHPTQDDVARVLQKLVGVPASALLGLEVLWAPDPPTESLTQEELLMRYPELQPL